MCCFFKTLPFLNYRYNSFVKIILFEVVFKFFIISKKPIKFLIIHKRYNFEQHELFFFCSLSKSCLRNSGSSVIKNSKKPPKQFCSNTFFRDILMPGKTKSFGYADCYFYLSSILQFFHQEFIRQLFTRRGLFKRIFISSFFFEGFNRYLMTW